MDLRENFQDMASNDHEKEMIQNDKFLRGVIANNLIVNELIYDNMKHASSLNAELSLRKPRSKINSKVRKKLTSTPEMLDIMKE